MAVPFQDLKIGQTILHNRGFEAVVKELVDAKEITVVVTKVDSAAGVYVGEERNVYANRIVSILDDVEEDDSYYDVEIETNGSIVRMSFKHFIEFTKIQTGQNK